MRGQRETFVTHRSNILGSRRHARYPITWRRTATGKAKKFFEIRKISVVTAALIMKKL
jgi:hypothetical protein